jgi:hypothetical protein
MKNKATNAGPNSNKTQEQCIALFFGDLKRWPAEPDGTNNFNQPQILAITEHMARTGDCLWHSMFMALGHKTCSCSPCANAAAAERAAERAKNPTIFARFVNKELHLEFRVIQTESGKFAIVIHDISFNETLPPVEKHWSLPKAVTEAKRLAGTNAVEVAL